MLRKLEVLVPAAVLSTAAIVASVAVAASSPSVATGSVSHVMQTSAALHGTVNPNGRTTTYLFQWGLTNAYGVASVERSAGHGTTTVSVTATAAGLIPGTVYHYRLIAMSKSGSTVGADRTFTTTGHPPPDAATGPPALVAQNAATLTAVINPHGQATTWTFQYGPTTGYGSQTVTGLVPAGNAPVTVAVSIQGIEARTIFHYRIVAQHGPFVTYGNDATFMTLPLIRPRPRFRARTRPRRSPAKPFTFTSSGSVAGPSWIPGAYDCAGDVAIRFLRGRREVASTLAPVQPNCTFAAQTVFPHLPGRGRLGRQVQLTVLVRFRGNGYLAPVRARPQSILLG